MVPFSIASDLSTLVVGDFSIMSGLCRTSFCARGDLGYGLPARIHGSVAGVSRMYRAVSRLFREYRAGHFSYIAAVSRSFAAVSRYFAAVAQAVSRVSRLSRAVSRASRECHTGGCAQLARALVRQSVNLIRLLIRERLQRARLQDASH